MPTQTAKKAAEAKPSKKAAPTSGGGAKGGKGKGKGAAGGVGEAPDPPEPNIAVSPTHFVGGARGGSFDRSTVKPE